MRIRITDDPLGMAKLLDCDLSGLTERGAAAVFKPGFEEAAATLAHNPALPYHLPKTFLRIAGGDAGIDAAAVIAARPDIAAHPEAFLLLSYRRPTKDALLKNPTASPLFLKKDGKALFPVRSHIADVAARTAHNGWYERIRLFVGA